MFDFMFVCLLFERGVSINKHIFILLYYNKYNVDKYICTCKQTIKPFSQILKTCTCSSIGALKVNTIHLNNS